MADRTAADDMRRAVHTLTRAQLKMLASRRRGTDADRDLIDLALTRVQTAQELLIDAMDALAAAVPSREDGL